MIAERFDVNTVREETGIVRVRKHVHHDTHAVSTPGYRDVVETRRVPVGRAVEATQAPHERDGVLVIPVYEERLVRQLFLVEELHVVQRREHDPQQQTVDLRREEVVVERFDPARQQWQAERG